MNLVHIFILNGENIINAIMTTRQTGGLHAPIRG